MEITNQFTVAIAKTFLKFVHVINVIVWIVLLTMFFNSDQHWQIIEAIFVAAWHINGTVHGETNRAIMLIRHAIRNPHSHDEDEY